MAKLAKNEHKKKQNYNYLKINQAYQNILVNSYILQLTTIIKLK